MYALNNSYVLYDLNCSWSCTHNFKRRFRGLKTLILHLLIEINEQENQINPLLLGVAKYLMWVCFFFLFLFLFAMQNFMPCSLDAFLRILPLSFIHIIPTIGIGAKLHRKHGLDWSFWNFWHPKAMVSLYRPVLLEFFPAAHATLFWSSLINPLVCLLTY